MQGCSYEVGKFGDERLKKRRVIVRTYRQAPNSMLTAVRWRQGNRSQIWTLA